MEPWEVTQLCVHEDRLVDMPSLSVLEKLIEGGYFSREPSRRHVYQKIVQQKTNESRSRALLRALMHKGKRAFGTLRRALEQLAPTLGELLSHPDEVEGVDVSEMPWMLSTEPWQVALLTKYEDCLVEMPSREVLEKLVEDGYFSTEPSRRHVYMKILEQPTNKDQARALLQAIIYKGKGAFYALRQALILLCPSLANLMRNQNQVDDDVHQDLLAAIRLSKSQDYDTDDEFLKLQSCAWDSDDNGGDRRDSEGRRKLRVDGIRRYKKERTRPPVPVGVGCVLAAAVTYQQALIDSFVVGEHSACHFAGVSERESVATAFFDVDIRELSHSDVNCRARSLSETTMKGTAQFYNNTTANKGHTKALKLTSLLEPTKEMKQREHPSQRIQRCLMLGQAGSGKTMACRKLANSWAQGKGWRDYTLVIYVAARELTRHSGTIDMQCLLGISRTPKLSDKEKSYVWQHIQENEERVIVIFDGIDEGAGSLLKLEAFQQIVKRQSLARCTVLMTSRPCGAAFQFVDKVDQFVELVGFPKESLNLMIAKKLTTDMERRLLSNLRSRADLSSLMENPLCAALVLRLMKDKDGEEIPRSRTKLYRMLMKNMEGKYLRRKTTSAYFSDEDDELNAKLKTEVQQCVEATRSAVCELALDGLMKDTRQFVFSGEDLQLSMRPSWKGVAREVGFLSTIQTRCVFTGEITNEYQFFHLSFQEYMAARAVAKAASRHGGWEKVVECIRHLGVGEETHLLWMFVAGEIDASKLADFIRSLESSVTLGPLQAHHMRMLILQCIAENVSMAAGDCQGLLQTAVGNVLPNNSLELKNINVSPDCCITVSHVLQLAEHITSVTLFNCGLTAQHCLVLAASKAIHRLQSVDIGYNPNVRGDGLHQLVKTLKNSCCLRYFSASSCRLGSGDGQSLKEFMQHSGTLQTLVCEDNTFGEAGFGLLSDGIASSKSLRSLYLSRNASSLASHSAIRCFCDALQASNTLEEVHVDRCSLNDSAAERILPAARGLKHLDLRLNKLTDNIIASIKLFLSQPTSQSSAGTLTCSRNCSNELAQQLAAILAPRAVLDLSGNDISPGRIEQLQASMPNVKFLHLPSHGGCQINHTDFDFHPSTPVAKDALASLDDCISSLFPRQKNVNLECCGISDRGADSLSNCLRSTCHLSSLSLQWNNITDDGVRSLAQGLKTNTTLWALDLSSNRVTTKGVDALLDSVSRFKHPLKYLNFDCNPLFVDRSDRSRGSDRRTISRLLLTGSLQFVGLGKTALTVVEVQLMVAGLRVHSILRGINLSENDIGDDGACLLSEALTHSKSLRFVALDSAKIGDQGARALDAALRENRSVMVLMGDNPASCKKLHAPGIVDGSLWYSDPGELVEILKNM